jgi:hypothetical protein
MFSGNGYVAALEAYSTMARKTNQMLYNIHEEFTRDRRINKIRIVTLRQQLDHFLYFAQIMQHQSQQYDYMYGHNTVLVAPDENQVLDWITNSQQYNTQQIKHETKALDAKKDELYSGIWDVWKKIREANRH